MARPTKPGSKSRPSRPPPLPPAVVRISWRPTGPVVALGAVLVVNLVLLVLLGVQLFRPVPTPTPGPVPLPVTADGVKLGRAFVPQLGAALGDGFNALATELEAGKSMSEADAKLKAVFQAQRSAAFARDVAPAFATIIPEGTEPDAAHRRAFVALARSFASGLKGE